METIVDKRIRKRKWSLVDKHSTDMRKCLLVDFEFVTKLYVENESFFFSMRKIKTTRKETDNYKEKPLLKPNP